MRQFTKDNGVFFEFHPTFCYVKEQESGIILLKGRIKNGLYALDSIGISNSTAYIGERTSADVWHARLGHPSQRIVDVIRNQSQLPFSTEALSFCDACRCSKSTRLPSSSSQTICHAPFELVHLDLWGPSPVPGINGHKYYIHFTDHFSRFVWIFPLHRKSDALSIFISFKARIEKFFGYPIKQLQTDGGGEYKKFKQFLDAHGITHRFSCPHTHAQNGLAERKHRHVVETGLTLMAQASLPTTFWVEAFETSVYLINRMPTPILRNSSPYEKLFKQLPDYSFLRTFGCTCYPNLKPYSANKLQPRALRCVFLGYSDSHKGYKCLHRASGRVYVSRDVIFNEHEFPFAQPTNPSKLPIAPSTPVIVHSFPHTAGPDPSSLSPTNALSPSPSPITNTSLCRSPLLMSDLLPTSPCPAPSNEHSSTSPLAPPSAQQITHPMTTRTKDNTRIPKAFDDFITTRYPLPYWRLLQLIPNLLVSPRPLKTLNGVHLWQMSLMPYFATRHGSLSLQNPISTLLVVSGYFRLKGKQMDPLSVIKLVW